MKSIPTRPRKWHTTTVAKISEAILDSYRPREVWADTKEIWSEGLIGVSGKNYTLFVFDNAANGCLNSPVLNPKQSGEVRLVFNFGTNPGVNITVILYGEFENLLEIDRNKAVLYDIYQR